MCKCRAIRSIGEHDARDHLTTAEKQKKHVDSLRFFRCWFMENGNDCCLTTVERELSVNCGFTFTYWRNPYEIRSGWTQLIPNCYPWLWVNYVSVFFSFWFFAFLRSFPCLPYCLCQSCFIYHYYWLYIRACRISQSGWRWSVHFLFIHSSRSCAGFSTHSNFVD